MNITSLFTVPDNDLQLQLITTVPIRKPYRGALLIQKRLPLGSYSRP